MFNIELQKVSDAGFFRITLITEDGKRIFGEWAGYRQLATIQYEGKTYIAGTDYGLLDKPETVYEIKEAPMSSVAARQLQKSIILTEILSD